MNERLHGIVMIYDEVGDKNPPVQMLGEEVPLIAKELSYDKQDLVDQDLLEQIYENILKQFQDFIESEIQMQEQEEMKQLNKKQRTTNENEVIDNQV